MTSNFGFDRILLAAAGPEAGRTGRNSPGKRLWGLDQGAAARRQKLVRLWIESEGQSGGGGGAVEDDARIWSRHPE